MQIRNDMQRTLLQWVSSLSTGELQQVSLQVTLRYQILLSMHTKTPLSRTSAIWTIGSNSVFSSTKSQRSVTGNFMRFCFSLHLLLAPFRFSRLSCEIWHTNAGSQPIPCLPSRIHLAQQQISASFKAAGQYL